MYKIEKGIPVPERKHPNCGKYPFKTMQQGDSFIISFKEIKHISDQIQKFKLIKSRIIYAFNQYKRRKKLTKKDFQISTRIMPAGVRCWRIK